MEPTAHPDSDSVADFTPAVLGDRGLVEHLIAERQASGGDRFDEVWEGSYFMSPLANNEHQSLATKLANIFALCTEHIPGADVMAGANVSDREVGWKHNYRCPDVVVVLPDSAAKDCDTHFCGGPDLCAEIASPGDRSRDKLEFYAGVGVRELLIIDRRPWKLELYRLLDGELRLVGENDGGSAVPLVAEVVDVTFRLQATAAAKPALIVRCERLQREWSL